MNRNAQPTQYEEMLLVDDTQVAGEFDPCSTLRLRDGPVYLWSLGSIAQRQVIVRLTALRADPHQGNSFRHIDRALPALPAHRVIERLCGGRSRLLDSPHSIIPPADICACLTRPTVAWSRQYRPAGWRGGLL